MSVRFDPFRGFDSLSRKMNHIVNEMEKGFSVEVGGFAPRVDIIEDEILLQLFVELPGIKKEDVKLSIDKDNVLIIKGDKKAFECKEDDCKSYIRNERSFGNFNRSFMLPDNIDTNNIDAKYDEGVLVLTLNKIEPEKPEEINIEIK